MRFIALLISLLFFVEVNTAQKQFLEIGASGGGMYYLGDINPYQHFYNTQPAFGLMFKYNVSEHYAFRFGMNFGSVAASDADFTDLYRQTRNYSFTNPVTDIHILTEFNFMPLPSEPAKETWRNFSTFIATGISFYIAPNPFGASARIAIPFGFGLKYVASKKINLGVECIMHYTFDDNLDLLEPTFKSERGGSLIGKQKSFTNNNDTFTFFGLYLGYKIFPGNSSCPAYGSKNFKKK